MTQQEVIELINHSITRLREYNNNAKSQIDNIINHEKYIQRGSRLLVDIQRGKLFEDESGREPEYMSLVGDEKIKELQNELTKTSNFVSLFKGDIAFEVYEKRENERKCKFQNI